MRSERSVQAGERPADIARALRIASRTMYGVTQHNLLQLKFPFALWRRSRRVAARGS